MRQTFGMNLPKITFRLGGREPRLRLQLPQGFAAFRMIFGRSGNRLEQNRAGSVVNGDFLTLDGAAHQPAQILAGFLHGHCFHAPTIRHSSAGNKRQTKQGRGPVPALPAGVPPQAHTNHTQRF